MSTATRTATASTSVMWLSASLAVLAVPVFLRETFLEMFAQWANSATYSYGYLILPAALYLAWRRRNRLKQVAPEPSTWGLLATVAAGVCWIAGYLTKISIAQGVAGIALIISAIWAVLGTATARILIYPLVYLFFMLPTSQFLVPPLMEFTADFTTAATRMSGVPIYRDGMLLSIPSGNFNVAESCSGLRALIIFAATGAFFAGINFESPLRRAVFITIAMVIAIIANGLRAYGIVMLGHISEMRWIDEHVLMGDIWFCFVLILMCLIGRRYSDLNEATPALNSNLAGTRTSIPAWAPVVAATLCTIVVAAIPFSGRAMERTLHSRSLRAFPELPALNEPWIFSATASSDWRPIYRAATREVEGQYLSDSLSIDAHIISYGNQTQDSELVNALNVLFDRDAWKRINGSSGSAPLDSGRTLSYRTIEIRSKEQSQRMIWYWYLIDDYATVHPIDVKLREAANLLAPEKSVASVVVLSASFQNDRAPTQAQLADLLRNFCAEVQVAPGGPKGGTSPCGSR